MPRATRDALRQHEAKLKKVRRKAAMQQQRLSLVHLRVIGENLPRVPVAIEVDNHATPQGAINISNRPEARHLPYAVSYQIEVNSFTNEGLEPHTRDIQDFQQPVLHSRLEQHPSRVAEENQVYAVLNEMTGGITRSLGEVVANIDEFHGNLIEFFHDDNS